MIVSWLLNFRDRMFLKSAVTIITYLLRSHWQAKPRPFIFHFPPLEFSTQDFLSRGTEEIYSYPISSFPVQKLDITLRSKCLENIITPFQVVIFSGFYPVLSVQTGAARSVMKTTQIKTLQMGFICHITSEAIGVVSGAEVIQLHW